MGIPTIQYTMVIICPSGVSGVMLPKPEKRNKYRPYNIQEGMCTNIDFVAGNHPTPLTICVLAFAGCSFENITGPIPDNHYKTISKTTSFL